MFEKTCLILKSNNPDPDYERFVFRNKVAPSSITDEDLIQLANAFKANNTIKQVTICIDTRSEHYHSLKWTEVGAQALGEALRGHPSLMKFEVDLMGADSVSTNQIIGFFEAITGETSIISFVLNLPIALSYLDYEIILSGLGDALLENKTLKEIKITGRIRGPQLSINSMGNFFLGLVENKALETLELHHLNISDEGVIPLASSLNKVATTLKKLEVYDAGITKLDFFQANRNLRELDLSRNPLQFEGIEQLMAILPNLIFLEKLNLSKARLNIKATNYLVQKWREFQLTISELNLDANAITTATLCSLINGNSYLKTLHVGYLGEEDIKKLLPFLSDRRCSLERFDFGGASMRGDTIQGLTPKTLSNLLAILNSNKFINIYSDTSLTKELVVMNTQNAKHIRIRAQQRALNVAIQIANAYTAFFKPETVNFSCLPFDTILTIMLMLYGNDIQGMDVLLCMQLIVDNFTKRRDLIVKGEYIPSNEPTIKQWWSQSIERQNQTKILFKSNLYRHLNIDSVEDKELAEIKNDDSLCCIM
jgi:hypothetical protein